MKIVGFEANGGLHLGVVEGDQVIDLQAVDATIPGDLAEVLRRNDGDLTPLKDAAKRARRERAPSARRAQIRPAGGQARQGHLPRLELSRARQGRLAARQHPEIPHHLHAREYVAGPARGADRAAEGVGDARLRGRADLRGRQARQAPHPRQRLFLHRRLFLRQRRLGARVSAQDHAVGHGQEFRPHRRLRPLDDHRRRIAARRQGPQDRDPPQRQRHAVRQHRQHDVPDRRDHRLCDAGHHARARRHRVHRHAVGRRPCPQAEPGLDEAGRHLRDRHRACRRPRQPDRRTEK